MPACQEAAGCCTCPALLHTEPACPAAEGLLAPARHRASQPEKCGTDQRTAGLGWAGGTGGQLTRRAHPLSPSEASRACQERAPPHSQRGIRTRGAAAGGGQVRCMGAEEGIFVRPVPPGYGLAGQGEGRAWGGQAGWLHLPASSRAGKWRLTGRGRAGGACCPVAGSRVASTHLEGLEAGGHHAGNPGQGPEEEHQQDDCRGGGRRAGRPMGRGVGQVSEREHRQREQLSGRCHWL